jgi:hypothetical protein
MKHENLEFFLALWHLFGWLIRLLWLRCRLSGAWLGCRRHGRIKSSAPIKVSENTSSSTEFVVPCYTPHELVGSRCCATFCWSERGRRHPSPCSVDFWRGWERTELGRLLITAEAQRQYYQHLANTYEILCSSVLCNVNIYTSFQFVTETKP